MEYEKSRQRKGSEFLEKQNIRLDSQFIYWLLTTKYWHEAISRSMATINLSCHIYHVVSRRFSLEKIQRLEMIR